MTKKKVKKGAQSPYVKYSKAPYPYKHAHCSHTNYTVQSMFAWKGKVCNVCNTVVEKFDDR